jgi:hypothetical protein
MHMMSCFLIFTIVSFTAAMAWSQDGGWPRVVKDGGTQIVVYQPQPDALNGVTLQSRVAVSIKRPEDKAPLFGALWVIATLDTDRDDDLARVTSIKIDRTRFADVPESDVQWVVNFLEAEARRWDLSLSLTRLKATLQPATGGPDADYRNDPPKIIIVNSAAILLLLDGEPHLQDVGSAGLQRVVNTALPVIFDSKSGQYWFYGSSVWFTTSDLLHGNWTSTDRAPSNIADLVKDTDTLDSMQADAGKAASASQLRAAKIVVATEPTELIVTAGSPKYSPLVGGDILFVTNTDSDIFMEVATQRHFIAISGRWFAGPSIQGPWSFVAPEDLPKAFANIPETSPKANDLAFVPGTDRAKDAVMDNAIPQTAEVSRRDAKIDVQYDGAPQFAAIPNTSLQYAENTPFQVIRAGEMYYACEEGVWYVSPSPTGPWSVSDARPVRVDDIPSASPVYNTKYVYIYDSTPDVVYVGYLPAYRWSFPYHGVVYYGTGWRYRGWFGRQYFPRPATWGFFVRYNRWAGWSYGMSWTAGWLSLSSNWGSAWTGWMPVFGPGYRAGFWSGLHAGGWFGPGGYRPPRPPSWRPPSAPSGSHPGITPRPRLGGRPGNNIYNRPGNSGIRPRPGTLPARPGAGLGPGEPQVRPGRPGGEWRGGGGRGNGGAGRRPDPPAPVTKPNTNLPNNVFTDREGNIHRNRNGNWQTRENKTWKPEAPPSPSFPTPAPLRPSPPQSAPAQRPTIRTEPRDGDSISAERDARNRGAVIVPGKVAKVNRRAAFWFKTVAAAGVAIAVLLVGDTVFAYRYVGARFAHDQGLLQAVEEVSSLEHELRREHIDTIDGVRPLLRGILEDRSSEIAWISILAANGQVQASSGDVDPHLLPEPARIRAVMQQRERHSAVRNTSRGEILIALLPMRPAVPTAVTRSAG